MVILWSLKTQIYNIIMFLIILTCNRRIFNITRFIIRRDNKINSKIRILCWYNCLWKCSWSNWSSRTRFNISHNHSKYSSNLILISSCSIKSIRSSKSKYFNNYFQYWCKWCYSFDVRCYWRSMSRIKQLNIKYWCYFQESISIRYLSRWSIKIHENIEFIIIRRFDDYWRSFNCSWFRKFINNFNIRNICITFTCCRWNCSIIGSFK